MTDFGGDAIDGIEQAQKDVWKAFEENEANFKPYTEAAGEALGQLKSLALSPPASVNDIPGARAAFDTGIQAINRNMDATGRSGSGAQLKGLHDFGNNYYQSALNNQLGRVSNFANSTFPFVGELADHRYQAASDKATMRVQEGRARSDQKNSIFNTGLQVGALALSAGLGGFGGGGAGATSFGGSSGSLLGPGSSALNTNQSMFNTFNSMAGGW